MKITRIRIKKIPPQKNLVGFAYCELEEKLFLGDIALFLKLNSDKIRIVFPEKKKGEKKFAIYKPISNEFYMQLEQAIQEKYNES
jgi:DNA-binding cell septation regulator SpoVG